MGEDWSPSKPILGNLNPLWVSQREDTDPRSHSQYARGAVETSPSPWHPLLDNSIPAAMSQNGPFGSSFSKMPRVRASTFFLGFRAISPGSPELGHGLGNMCKSATLLFLAFGGVR